MSIRALKPIDFLLPSLVGLVGLLLLLTEPGSLYRLRNNLFDQYQRGAPRVYEAAPVRIIDIDEESLARHGQWPWPRPLLAQLVDALNAAGAAAIGFDVIFSERDRTSPLPMADIWQVDALTRGRLGALPDHDRTFAHSLAQAPTVLGFALERARGGRPALDGPGKQPDTPPSPLARPYRYIHSGASPTPWLSRFEFAVGALPMLQDAARGNGALTFLPDNDGVVRRIPLALNLSGEPVPTLSAELLRVGQNARNMYFRTDEHAGITEIRIGELTIPTDAHGEFWMHYTQPAPARYIPAWKVLAGEAPAEELSDRLALVGASAQGLLDLRFSALGRIIPGVEIHAQALEQILTGRFLVRPSWAIGLEAVTLLAAVALVSLLALHCRALRAAGASALVLFAILGGGWLAFRACGLLFNTVTPALSVAAAFIAGSLIHHFASEREQRWLKSAFARYVSPNRVAYLLDHRESMALGGSKRECSFVFTDLEGFTSLMENTEPTLAVQFLNDYLDGMIAIAFRYEGTLDRIVGDAVAIMFSAPLPQSDHRRRALDCAMEMDDFACRYEERLRVQGIAWGKTRIGIHSGEVVVGNFGGRTMFDYRALGDPVSTASRLEGANKYLGTNVCLSAAALPGNDDRPANGKPVCDIRPVGRLLLKGKTQPLQVYEPVAAFRAGGYAPLSDYRAAYALMRQEADGENGTGAIGGNGVTASVAADARAPATPLECTEHMAREERATARGECVAGGKDEAPHGDAPAGASRASPASGESPALRAFRQLAERHPADPLVALHLGRLQNGKRGDLIVMSGK